jgi:hypothetical protein
MAAGSSDNFVADLTGHIFQYSAVNLIVSSFVFLQIETSAVGSLVTGCEMQGKMWGNPR